MENVVMLTRMEFKFSEENLTLNKMKIEQKKKDKIKSITLTISYDDGNVGVTIDQINYLEN